MPLYYFIKKRKDDYNMKNKNILALVLVLCISLSMMGCGKTNTKDNTENVVATEIQDTKNVQETEKNEEPKYTEHETYFLEDGVESEGNQYDMSTMKPSDKKYTLTKSVDLYYLNEKKCGYTKGNIDIQIITSNDDYCYVNLEHKYFLMKTKDVEDAKLVDENEEVETNTQDKESEQTSNTITKETTKKDTSTKKDTTSTKNESANTNTNSNSNNTSKEEQPTNSEPVAQEQPQEEPTTSNKYTPEEAIAYYRSQIEAQGMQWDPSIKAEASWGTGWIPLSKDELNSDYIANTMAGYNYGDGTGNPDRLYYLEVTGSDENYVYVTIWNA